MPQGVYNFLQDGLKYIFDNSNVLQLQLINYSMASGNVYDDEVLVTGSTISYASGLIFPVGGKQGSVESLLFEQGKIKTSDKKIYIFGTTAITSSGLIVGIGSPSNSYYKVINDGSEMYEVNGSPVYKKLFVRYNDSGSVY